MKRSEKQKRISAAAKSLVTGIKNGRKPNIYSTGYAFTFGGKPQNSIGYVLSRAGIKVPSNTYGHASALAKALGTDEVVLPQNVRDAVTAVASAEFNAYSTGRIPRAVAKPLLALSEVLATQKIRKSKFSLSASL